MNKVKGKENKGFTLVEVIVASLILVVALIPILASFVVSSKMNVQGRHKEQAMTVAGNILEGVKACGPENTLKWAQGSNTGYTVLPADANMTVEGESYSYLTPEKDISSYVLADGKTLGQVIGDDAKKVQASLNDYLVKIDGVLMGQTRYDAYVYIKQSAEDTDNLVSYAFFDDYFDKADMKIMKYFEVTVYVNTDFNGLINDSIPDKDDPDATMKIAELVGDLENNYMAKYSGTIISQT